MIGFDRPTRGLGLLGAGACAWTLILLALAASRPASADVPGSRDHPLVSRYAGSEIVRYDLREFDGYGLMMQPASASGGKANNPQATMPLEGRVTKITYLAPPGRSTLEVFRNYQTALVSNGLELLFLCQNEQCGGRNFNHAVVDYTAEFGDNYADQRYLAAKLARPEGDVYVSLYTVRNTTSGGVMRDRVFTQLDVIEVRAMQRDMVTVDAGYMANEMAQQGRVALYGIYFDTGSANLRPESGPTLQQIARLLQSQPNLRLIIVGHTDNSGTFQFNMDLSQRRAQAVERTLVEALRIRPDRLMSAGVGYLAPVASNSTEQGRAANRRVELIPQ